MTPLYTLLSTLHRRVDSVQTSHRRRTGKVRACMHQQVFDASPKPSDFAASRLFPTRSPHASRRRSIHSKSRYPLPAVARRCVASQFRCSPRPCRLRLHGPRHALLCCPRAACRPLIACEPPTLPRPRRPSVTAPGPLPLAASLRLRSHLRLRALLPTLPSSHRCSHSACPPCGR